MPGTVTVELPLLDALQIGQTMRALGRTKPGARVTVPPGVRPLLSSVGAILASAADAAMRAEKP